MSIGRGILDPEDVREATNGLERLLGVLDTDDNYMAAVVQNTAVTSRLIKEMSGVSGPGGRNPPIGSAGISIQNIDEGDTGRAIFFLNGDRFVYTVEPNQSVSRDEVVEVLGEDGEVTPRDDAKKDDILGGSFRGGSFTFNGKQYGVPTVVESDEVVIAGNQEYKAGNFNDISSSLSANGTKTMARIEVGSDKVLLVRGMNASAISSVEYNIYTDDANERNEAFSGSSPPATPPDLYEPAEDGYMVLSDFMEIEFQENQGNTYSDAQARIEALILDA
jgi:hypothetical protein